MASKQQVRRGLDEDEIKTKRKLSNCEAARRSRMKKQQYVDELMVQKQKMVEENEMMRKRIDETSQAYLHIESKNNVVRGEVAKLTDRLLTLNSVLEISSEVSGLALDIPDIPNTLLHPLELSFPANLHMFHY